LKKLWLLKPNSNLPSEKNPWNPWFGKCFGFLICAENEFQARKIANDNGGNEGSVWLDPSVCTCLELTPGNVEEGVVLMDFRSG
jgi:hypothetical protein